MARGILLVFSNPSSSDRVMAFNEWYSEVHLPEFLRIPGIRAARRFQLSASQMRAPGDEESEEPGALLAGGRRYLAAYEVETDDFGALCDVIMATRGDRTQSDVIEGDPLPLTLLFEQMGDLQTSKEPRPD